MAMAPHLQYLINVFLSMNFVPRTHVVVSVRVALAIHTDCARGLARGKISVGLSMYSCAWVLGMSRTCILKTASSHLLITFQTPSRLQF